MHEIWITIKGTQLDDAGEATSIELMTAGQRHRRNGVDYITYKETEVSGLEGTTTLLKVHPDRVTLMRSGSVDQKQEFSEGQRHSSLYSTPYGQIKMSVLTKRLEVDLDDGNGLIDIEYDLEIDGQWHSENRLSVEVREDKMNGH